MRISYSAAALCGAMLLSGCATFPASVAEGEVEIQRVIESIECELAAVANDPRFGKRNLPRWKALTDLDLTLVRSLGADGKVAVTAPYGLATVSAAPSAGITGTDTSIAHVEFVTPIRQAATKFQNICSGDDPSETGMGLAIWLKSALIAVKSDNLTGVTYTKQFQLVANAGARFGYSLVPVVNTVLADVGAGTSRDKTNRITVAMTPPADTPKPDAIPVFIVPGPKGAPLLQHGVTPTLGTSGTARTRALTDPTLLYLLQRRAPVKIGP